MENGTVLQFPAVRERFFIIGIRMGMLFPGREETMNTAADVLQFVRENDVKFIRLAFCDIFGTQKNIAIMPDQLSRAFETGISFDASAVRGFPAAAKSDFFLIPDPNTLSILPWRPSHGRVVRLYCNIHYPDGRPFEGDGRYLLRKTVDKAQNAGYTFRIGPECEFYLFLTDEAGYPSITPHDRAGYCDMAPYDRGENVRREICLMLEEMGINPESSHHGRGPGQNEIDFAPDAPLACADHLMAFRSTVKAVASNNGLYASFLPKPLENASGSNLHVNISIHKEGQNLFEGFEQAARPEARAFLQGILRRSGELSAFLNPLTNSYPHLGEWETPRYISWSCQNCSQLVRIPAATGDDSRIEVRQPDPACNPYFAFLLLLEAGMEGIREKLALEPALDMDLYRITVDAPEIPRLPADLGAALILARNSDFLREIFPEAILENYIAEKTLEWECARGQEPHAYAIQRYFPRV